MDTADRKIFTDVLSDEEISTIPHHVHEKLKKYLDEVLNAYCKERVSGSRLDEYEQKLEDLQSQVSDDNLKLKEYEKNVNELRKQLDIVSSERIKLIDQTNVYERENCTLRNENIGLVDERDTLLKVIERHNITVERLQEDLHSHQVQLKNAISAKCVAIARVDEIEGKEVSLDFKEKRLDQERSILQNQIQTLTEDLNRNITSLQNIRRDHTMQYMHLENRLSEKIEELKISQTQCNQYKQTIDRLTDNIQELSNKLLLQNEESNKMIDFYKKELDAKSKLTELYKNNCDDTDSERNELNIALTDMKRMLSDASQQFGELETKHKATLLQNQRDLEEKDQIIESQKLEISSANELLKQVRDETVENAISKLAPSAAITSRLIRTDMSLTELYSLYVKSSEECELQKKENACINLQLKTILHELSENAPIIKKKEVEYEKLLTSKNLLLHELEEVHAKKIQIEEDLVSANTKISHLEREKKKMHHLHSHLSRQVCYLLNQKEKNDSCGLDQINISINDIISKELVTFKNVEELQSNNEKLLIVIRDLTSKLEDAENKCTEFDYECFEHKINQYEKKVSNMQEILDKQNNTLATVVNKCERYKKMYFELQKSCDKNNINIEELPTFEEHDMEVLKSTEYNEKEMTKQKLSDTNQIKRIKELEHNLEDSKELYKKLKQQFDDYIIEKKHNDKIVTEQFDSMQEKVRSLTSNNCKLLSSLEHTKEQIKLQKGNIIAYKQQISTLEDRSKNYETTVVKHEQTVHFLKDELIKAQQNCSIIESEIRHLRQENQLLKDSITRLQSEKQSFFREHQNQNLLLNNLEIIKSNLERSEVEGRARLEQRLDDTVRELSAQRRRFQEEEDRFRELSIDLQRQLETAKQRVETEKAQNDKAQIELGELRQEIKLKCSQIDDLSSKLQECLTPSKNENPIALANKKCRDLELKLEEAKIEITSLTSELSKAREHADQYYKMCQSAESEIKNIHEVHTTFALTKESEIKEFKSSELNLKAKIEELESQLQLSNIATNQNDESQLSKTTAELKDALLKLTESNKTLRVLRSEYNILTESLTTTEKKYANEMILHSADIQEFTKLKEDYIKIQDEVNGLKMERESTKTALEELKKTNDDSLKIFNQEKTEFEIRISDMSSLNSHLHDQIEGLTHKLNVLSQTTLDNSKSIESQLDMSISSDVNRSIVDDGNKSMEQLLQIIKYLRKEKDLIDAKLDIVKAENTRMLSENTILQKKIDELQGFLNQERSKTEISISSASKHGEILRKIETLNAITDSNRILREERNSLTIQIADLNKRVSTIQAELFPLQNLNRDLTIKMEDLTTENTTLRTEAIKWRQRANVLVEKSNKNPEEFKRLQMERENLAKMLTADKENMKKLQEEIETLKTNKERLENDILTVEKNLQNISEEKKKISDDFASLKLNNTRILQEVMELKNKLLQKEEIVQKLTEDLESKETQLHDSKNKEIQIRKIAKRYKDSYIELSNKTPSVNTVDNVQISAENMEMGTNSANDSIPNMSSNLEIEQYRTKVDGLNQIVNSLKEENEKLQKEINTLTVSVSEYQQREIDINAQNEMTQELENTKIKLREIEQSSQNHEEVVHRLTRENETMLLRINQLNRQLGQQQSSKPSTSTVPITEKINISEPSPRTANVKPMSGSATVQQSATVTPWRGSETPLASIRPISVQSSRTAAILPNSQQPSGAGSNSSSSCSNTALVPPQQQVHTTGSTSVESMSSSPTSSHNDYIPSTSSNSVAVAAIPPMGSAAESSQEAESVQQQQTDTQIHITGIQQQVVALVSPRVEGASSPNIQHQLDINNQQPSTSGSSSFSAHLTVNSHNRHTPSSSNVTTSQPGSSVSHKRPRDIEEDSPSTNEDSINEKLKKIPKLVRVLMHGEESEITGQTDSEVEYQVPTSSQHDQEDDIVEVDSDGVDDGPAHRDGDDDSYVQDQDVDGIECVEVNESNIRVDIGEDNNEVEFNEFLQVQIASGMDNPSNDNITSQKSSESDAHSQQIDPQIQTISSGSSETNTDMVPQVMPWMKASSSGASSTRQQKTFKILQHHGFEPEDVEDSSISNSRGRSDSSSQDLKCDYTEDNTSKDDVESVDDCLPELAPEFAQNEHKMHTSEDDKFKTDEALHNMEISTVDVSEEEATSEITQNVPIQPPQSGGASQSQIRDIQQSQIGATSEDVECVDGVSSEGEKQSVEELEEEGREAEASTSPSINTRSKAIKSGTPRRARGFQRGGRPTPIVWQEAPGNSRIVLSNQRNQEQAMGPLRGFPNQRSQRGRRMRRPTGGNYQNMRYN